MTTRDITITRADVLNKVHEDSTYIGIKNSTDKDSFDTIPLLDGEESVVDPWLDEAISDIRLNIWRYLYSTTTATASVTLQLCMPANWQTIQEDSLKDYMLGYCSEVVLSRWLLYRSADESQKHASLAQGILANLVNALNARMKARRDDFVKSTDVMDDDTILAKLKENAEELTDEVEGEDPKIWIGELSSTSDE